MKLRDAGFCLVLSVLLAPSGFLLSQNSSADLPNRHPFPAGQWESPETNGSVVGIYLVSIPVAAPDAVEPEGTARDHGSRLQIGVFQRQHERVACGEENFFLTGWTGPGSANGFATYTNGRLEVHYHDPVSGSEIHVQLVHDPIKDVWTGHFQRKGFDGEVTLHRTTERADVMQGGCSLESPMPRVS